MKEWKRDWKLSYHWGLHSGSCRTLFLHSLLEISKSRVAVWVVGMQIRDGLQASGLGACASLRGLALEECDALCTQKSRFIRLHFTPEAQNCIE